MRAGVALLVLALNLAGASAYAQTPSPATDEDPACMADIRDDFTRAGTLYEDRQYGAAAPLFEQLAERCPSPRLLFYLGAAWRASGRVQSAIAVWERYLGMGGVERAEAVRRDLTELRQSLVELELTVSPPEASVTIDGRLYPAHSTALRLDPIEHVIEVSAPHHVSHRQVIPAQRGGRVTLTVELRLAERTGRLTVASSVSAAQISINGAFAGVGRVTRDLTPGNFHLRVEAPEYELWRRTVTVERGARLRVDAVLARPPRRVWVLPVVVAGAVLVVTGVVLAVAWFTRGTEPPLTVGMEPPVRLPGM